MKNQTKTEMQKQIEALTAQIAELKAQIPAPKPNEVKKLKREEMFVSMEYNGQNIYGTLVHAEIERNGNKYFYLEGEDGQVRKFNKERVDGNYLPELEEKVQEIMAVREAVNAQKRQPNPLFD